MAAKLGIVQRTVESKIIVLRGKRVILDRDLAALYGVDVKRLNEQVKRNKDRFPDDFLFQITRLEMKDLRSQTATSKARGGRRYAPFAFTEHGAVMAATILNSPRAVEMSVFVVRAFVRLRQILNRNREIALRFYELEQRLDVHDQSIQEIIGAIKQLIAPPARGRKGIGFCSAEQVRPKCLRS